MTTMDRSPAPDAPPSGALRCSDADRERICGLLHAAVGEGRLTVDEVDERVAAAYAARHHPELDALVADLPRAEPARSGWGEVTVLARRQLMADAAVLAGRTPATRARRVQLLLVALAALFLVVGALVLLLHGWVPDGTGEGFEHVPGHVRD